MSKAARECRWPRRARGSRRGGVREMQTDSKRFVIMMTATVMAYSSGEGSGVRPHGGRGSRAGAGRPRGGDRRKSARPGRERHRRKVDKAVPLLTKDLAIPVGRTSYTAQTQLRLPPIVTAAAHMALAYVQHQLPAPKVCKSASRKLRYELEYSHHELPVDFCPFRALCKLFAITFLRVNR
uniref:Uncharacterized protein n=1 Tax=Branchiostoma floridae TaxID=7739 RepID=C3XR07_BRAFL|eukprot:XP_002613116.1 hypothetical protein BRAFLDRAFT_120231 [Branchiostoma floridae]